MAKEFIEPFWVDIDTKDRVNVYIRYDNGELVRAVLANDENNPNPDWAELFEHYTEEQVTEFTQEHLNKRKEEEEVHRIREKEHKEREESERLFNHKIKLFEIEDIQGSKNRKLKSKIRKAKTIEEASIIASALVTLELLEAQNKEAQKQEVQEKE